MENSDENLLKKSKAKKDKKIKKIKEEKEIKPIIEDVLDNYKFCCNYLKNTNGILKI